MAKAMGPISGPPGPGPMYRLTLPLPLIVPVDTAFDTKHFEDFCCFPVWFTYSYLSIFDNNFVSVMPHDRELRQMKDIDYKNFDAVGKPGESVDANKKQKFRRKYYIQEKKELNEQW